MTETAERPTQDHQERIDRLVGLMDAHQEDSPVGSEKVWDQAAWRTVYDQWSAQMHALREAVNGAIQRRLEERGLVLWHFERPQNELRFRSLAFEVDEVVYERVSVGHVRPMIMYENPFMDDTWDNRIMVSSSFSFDETRSAFKEWRGLEWEPDLRF